MFVEGSLIWLLGSASSCRTVDGSQSAWLTLTAETRLTAG